MSLTPSQIREALEEAKKCSHPVVFYNCDDVGYPSGWVETWACLVCGLYKHHSTGGQGCCFGKFGNDEFLKTKIIVCVNSWFCKHYSKYPFESFDHFFEEFQNSLKENNKIIYVREGKGSRSLTINKESTDQEIKNIISIIHKALEL